MHIQTNLIFDEDKRPGAPRPHVFVARFEDRGDVGNADLALQCAGKCFHRVSDWLADILRPGESAARWALLFDGRKNHTVRVGIVR